MDSQQISGVIDEFRENDKFRKKRKKGVILYHEILSFHTLDTEKITPGILQNIAQKYIELRGEKALSYVVPHFDKKHTHIHFVFSGTEYKSSKTLRMNNKVFKKVRKGIERYQIEQFPELKNSIVYHQKKECEKIKGKSGADEKIHQMEKRSEKNSDKEELQLLVDRVFQKAKNKDDFFRKLEKNEYFELYEYRGKINGVFYKNKKYRFKRLGITQESFEELQKREIDFERKKEVLKQLHEYNYQRALDGYNKERKQNAKLLKNYIRESIKVCATQKHSYTRQKQLLKTQYKSKINKRNPRFR